MQAVESFRRGLETGHIVDKGQLESSRRGMLDGSKGRSPTDEGEVAVSPQLETRRMHELQNPLSLGREAARTGTSKSMAEKGGSRGSAQ